MVFTPPKRERIVIYWPKSDRIPDAYKQMLEYVKHNYYWVELICEVRGREKLDDLYDLARQRKFDVLLIEHLRDLGPTATSRIATAAAMSMHDIRIMAFWDLSFDEIPLQTMRLLTIGLMQENVAYRYYEKTKERHGRGYKIEDVKPRKKRIDAGLPKKMRTPEQQQWVADQVAKYHTGRAEKWRVQKAVWIEQREVERAERRRKREAEKLADKTVDSPAD